MHSSRKIKEKDKMDITRFDFDLLRPCLQLIKDAKLPDDHPLAISSRRQNPRKKELLDLLTDFVGQPEKCQSIAKYFKPILAELVGRAIESIGTTINKGDEKHLQIAYSISTLLNDYPYLIDITDGLFDCFQGTWEGGTEVEILMNTFVNLLEFDVSRFLMSVNWNLVIFAFQNQNLKLKYSAMKCLTLAAGFMDLSSLLPEEVLAEFISNETAYVNSKQREPLKPIADNNFTDNWHCSDTLKVEFKSEDIRTSLVPVAGMLMPVKNKVLESARQNNGLVMTESISKALQSLVLSVTTGIPVLLEGELGTGKTVILEYFASMMQRFDAPEILKLQLGDQTDSKSILGIYVCTETPGEFKWQPGTLTQAVTNGSWLILEDIDSAPLDVISVLLPLLENKPLSIPGQSKPITPASGFQIFMTRRLQRGASGHYHQNSPSKSIEHLCSKIHLQSLTKEELNEIVSKKHPNLETIIPKLVDVYCMISSDLSLQTTQDTILSNLPADKRQCTSRDFFKWCQRVADRFQYQALISANLDVFQEAFSCFCVPVPKFENRVALAHAIGTKLGLTREKSEFYVRIYKAHVQRTQTNFTAGRASLAKKHEFGMRSSIMSTNYAFTRHSLNLLEEIAICVSHSEPILLVGETGCGKTATIQYLATQCGHKFSAINMSQQSDVTDLLGGFKPVDFKQIVTPLRETFEGLFVNTFSQKQNMKFLGHIQQCWAEKKWEILLKLMEHCKTTALKRKGLKIELKDMDNIMQQWRQFAVELKKMKLQLKEGNALAFAFVEGRLIQAIRNGEWILLDEINLATTETLECLSGLLESKSGSVVLVERGDAEPVRRHEDFRLFACMNPATDVGKKDLPFGIRNRFTEIYVDELKDVGDLKILVAHYLKDCDVTSPLVDGIVKFYQMIQRDSNEKLTDGTGHRPHYSLRTLCRALEYSTRNTNMMLPRAIYEGFCLSFLTQLDRSSHPTVETMIRVNILGHLRNSSSLLSQPIPCPGKSDRFCQIEGYWIERGEMAAQASEEYVITASVRDNLRDLARVVSGRKYPVLLQGETSVGKTSLINYLAKSTGNQCVRINNHEHTDIQEYIGCYSADENGKLVFKDGLLVDAMRKGYWIILDELNLAPTDVLEALNRLLDDNRELFIAETQETIKAHSKFMLFATQNPPGQYGGRKILSRAFRNRFVELHFDEIPSKELQTILHKRCHLPRSYCGKFVAIMEDLQARRKSSGIFAGKHGFITLRDLFRWAERYRQTPSEDTKTRFYDWDQHIAEDGYMLLAGRCRKPEEAIVIQETVERIMKRKINLDLLYKTGSLTTTILLQQLASVASSDFQHLVWTSNLQRMAVLVGRAIQFNEPILLVGDTGCGKTTICQLYSHLRNSQLLSVNCHMHTESSDFIGGLRPVRHREQEDEMRLFEWCDGPLVCALKEGSSFLIDEISLADDSVLERLNSVLETEKTLVLAEKGGSEDSKKEDIEIIVASEDFRLMATMNPGGDFGKKELSPALRNRFTEIWCPQSENREDFIKIVNHNIENIIHEKVAVPVQSLGDMMMNFVEWFSKTEAGQRTTISVRDLLSWANFINKSCPEQIHECKTSSDLSPQLAFIHGAFLVFIDAIGSGSSWNGPSFSLEAARTACLSFLLSQTGPFDDFGKHEILWNDPLKFGITPFMIERGSLAPVQSTGTYSLTTTTTSENTLRLLRALQLARPILLEGSPGVGKTSLVTALARFSGNQLTRINLSEQTDVTDLFGADLPVEGGKGGEFAWRDGPFLKALKAGHWIVLDELNLASQSVLEGLNACFDHRGEVFVPELGKSFKVKHETTRIFACQNPLSQGGGRKGLPKSFLNRFTKVYIEHLKEDDLQLIITASYPHFQNKILMRMIRFNSEMQKRTMVDGDWGRKGSPWEFNVRDILRWCELVSKYQHVASYDPSEFLNLIYVDRMRTMEDKEKVIELYTEIFDDQESHRKSKSRISQFSIGAKHIQVGHSVLQRTDKNVVMPLRPKSSLQLLRKQLPCIESVMKCIEMNWMAILVGPKACGKTSIVESIAQLTGNTLNTLAMNSNMDTTELLGGFEQVNLNRHFEEIIIKMENLTEKLLRNEIENMAKGTLVRPLKQLLAIKMRLKNLQSVDQRNQSNEDSSTVMIKKFHELELIIKEANEMAKENELFTTTIEDLQNRFCHVKEKFEAEGMSLHAKGQFEWVDGILVEALKKGEWLLIDNVNFCSPSVLDRLNGLLEPNGVLSIDERGDQNDEIPTVKPHPNFRLFLAMDPKNGEISRAMRNRGIEIYVTGEDESGQFSAVDKLHLIVSVGLKDTVAQRGLLAVHEELTKIHPHSITDLVKAARLTNDVIARGFESRDALKLACLHVFAGNELPIELKEEITKTVDSCIASNHNGNEQTKQILVSPSISEFSTMSVLSRLSREGMIVNHAMTENSDPQMIILAIKAFLERATIKDWPLRLKLIQSKIGEECEAIAEIACLMFKEVFQTEVYKNIADNLLRISGQDGLKIADDISFDLRLNSRMLQDSIHVASQTSEMKSVLQSIMSLFNRMEMLLQRTMVAIKENLVENDAKVSKKSLMLLSKQCALGQIPPSRLPHLVVHDFFPFFHLLETCLKAVFLDTETQFTDEQFQKILFGLQWRDHFWNLCLKSNAEESSPSMNFQKALFALHWKWLKDELVPLLKGHTSYGRNLEAVISRMTSGFNEGMPVNWNHLKLILYDDHPPPYKSFDLYAVQSILEAFLDEFNLEHQLKSEPSKDKLDSLLEQNTCDKRAKLFQILKQYYELAANDHAALQEIQALQMAISAPFDSQAQSDIEMNDTGETAATTKPVDESRDLKPELLLVNSQINLFAWQNILRAIVAIDRPECRIETNREDWDTQMNADNLTRIVDVLKKFGITFYNGDLRPLAAVCLYSKEIEEKQAYELPRHVLPMLRAHCHEISTYKMQNMLIQILESGSDRITDTDDKSYKLFSNSTTRVLIPWTNKKLSMKTQIIESADHLSESQDHTASSNHFDWKISVQDIYQTQSLLKSFHAYSWFHGGLTQQLPRKLWECMFEDTMRMLLFSMDALQLGNLGYSEVVEHSWTSRKKLLDACKANLNDAINHNTEIPSDIKNILRVIETCMDKETQSMEQNQEEANEGLVFMRNVRLLGEVMSCLGLCRFLLSLPKNPYDHAEEARIKCHYYEEELAEINQEITFRYEVEENLSGLPKPIITTSEEIVVEHYTSNEPRMRLLLKRRNVLISEIKDLRDKVAARPNPSQYDSLLKDLTHFHDNIANHSLVLGLLLNASEALHENTDIGKPFPRNLQRRIKAWIASTNHFINQLEKTYPLYPDIILPVKWSLTQVVSGFSSILTAMDWRISNQTFDGTKIGMEIMSSSEVCSLLVSLPMSSRTELTLPSDIASKMMSLKFAQNIQVLLGKEDRIWKGLNARILNLALSHIVNDALLRGSQTIVAKDNFKAILNNYNTIWLEFSEEKRKKEAEEDSMYKFKSRSHCIDSDDTEMSERQYKELFPSFGKEFNDLIPKDTLNDDDDDDGQEEEQNMTSISSCDDKSHDMSFVDMNEIYNAMQAVTDCKSGLTDAKLIKVFLQGYKEVMSLSALNSLRTDPLLDCNMAAPNLLFMSLLKQSLAQSTTISLEAFDIYHESNIAEVQKLTPLLAEFSSRITELLNEFPEHPALIQIQQIIDRILSFPVNQPLMKFMTGLEILLKQSQDWESYASSRVSLKVNLQSVTNQIVEWRKLELKCWPYLLQVVEKKFSREAQSWILKIYSALEEVRAQKEEAKETTTQNEVAKLLQGFVESSSVGELKTRLELLSILYETMKDGDKALSKVVWNIYHYYNQFSSNVDEHIQKSKSPIEKDLKDFVKIAKWKDINFYAMKLAAEKSHRTLHKFVRRYEEILSAPVSSHLKLVQNKTGNEERPESEIELNKVLLSDTGRFISSKDAISLVSEICCQNEWLNDSPKLSSKLVKKCSKYLHGAKHDVMIKTLDEFTGDVIANVKELQSIDVLSLPEEKRANARKHLSLRKRKALATLFKTLSNMGLSYRKGLALRSQNESDTNVLSPVIEINGDVESNDTLSVLKRDCHTYYFKCLARQSALDNATRSPSKELNPQDISRSRGFTDHLHSVVQKQKKFLNGLIANYESLRSKEVVLGSILNEKQSHVDFKSLMPAQSSSLNNLMKLKELLDLTVYVMKQFRLLVKCCPQTKHTEGSSPIPDEMLPPVNNLSIEDEDMKKLLQTVEMILESSTRSKSEIDQISKESQRDATSFLVTWSHYKLQQQVMGNLVDNCKLMSEIEAAFTLRGESPKESFAKSVSLLKDKVLMTVNEMSSAFANGKQEQAIESTAAESNTGIGKTAEHLLKGILTCVQELMKLETPIPNDETKSPEDEDINEDFDLLEGHLIPHLERNFFNEINMLKSSSVSQNLTNFFEETRDLFDSFENDGSEFFLVYPIIQQYTKMVEYFLEKLLHLHRTSCKALFVLAGIFTELATEGFCLPPDEVETSGEGATEFEDIQGGGAGEGEGMKDVSDQIESEDQLHGAEQEGKEKETKPEDDRNVPDEEHGIEMSDDFDGRMHDVDPDAEQNESESDQEKEEEEEQPDEKMGNLDGIEEDKFDEKFWGDSEDEDENEAADEDDTGAGANGEAESELVAKDENEGEQKGKDKKKENKSKEDEANEEEINELSNELDENDSDKEDENEGRNNEEKIDNKEHNIGDDDFGSDLELDKEELTDEQNTDENQKEENQEEGTGMEVEEEIQEENDDDDGETNPEEERLEMKGDENKEEENEGDAKDEEEKGQEPKDEREAEREQRENDEATPQNEAQASEARPESSSNQSVASNDTTRQAQNTTEEQHQQQQNQGHGSSQQEGSEGHSGISNVTQNEAEGLTEKKERRRKDYNRSRKDRSLADDVEQKLKRLKTEDVDENETADQKESAEKRSSDLYKHIQGDDDYDTHALDSATMEQSRDQPDFKRSFDDSDVDMEEHESDDHDDNDELAQIDNDDIMNPTKRSALTNEPRAQDDLTGAEDEIEDNNEPVDTEEPMLGEEDEIRKIDSGYFTSKEALIKQFDFVKLEADNEALRKDLEQELASWAKTAANSSQNEQKAIETWRKYEHLTSPLAQQLCEQLRLVLEPTMASKLRGDYRTGKRLNMRKVIPYIASQFRKDKIWLRRTKKSRRQYQILLAVDDSSSMGDNHSKQLAFESLAVISNALTWLEAGELAVCSFGESTKLLHAFKEPFNEEAGAHILRDFTFEQKKTQIAQMLNICTTFMAKERSNILKSSSNRMDTSQLLLIVSDGRGIFLEGKEVVERSVRHAREAGIFIVFIILDNPSNRDSILDIRIPIFKPGGGIPQIKSYIEEFPFPFYLILRDINSLPSVLSDALRQWFELVTSMT